ncbi:MAG TPA: xanthine dehydrogenase family protein subunit M [Candidatus Angelobacter sp.]|jgi:xanthine dehydrogenase YagS FAD-binding subunit|nr:xanthine dehydrogenase family protein subunit M [Candidatus Angelobacter sp.]
MLPFEYAKARNENDAMDRVRASRAAFVAGGTTLIDLMKLNVMLPAMLVDINGLPLDKIEILPDGGLRIGAMVRNSDMAHHAEVIKRFPVLSQAVLAGASPQLRNMATTGGNLMQRTRCYYFRDTAYACNKRQPGSGCAAIDGFNRIHAVLGGSDQCIATHPSDMAVALVALDAVVHIKSPSGGERKVAAGDFHLLPGNTPHKETVVEPGELITYVTVPSSKFAASSAYVKLRDRASYEFALASAGAALDLQGNKIHAARLVLGGVATKPWRSPEAEHVLTSGTTDEKTFHAAAEAAMKAAVAHKYNGFKIELAKRAIVRALASAAQSKGEGQS